MNQNDKQAYLEQIDKYYRHSLSRFDVIQLGMTPEILVSYGAQKLPIIMQQSVLTKCIRKKTGSRSAHEISRNIIECLPEQIEQPIFLVQDKERESLAIISDVKDKDGNNILIAIKLDENANSVKVNSVKSIYGKTNLREYVQKEIALNQLHIIDNKKAEKLSRLVGFQLPQALITFDYDKNVSPSNEKVNHKNSVLNKLENYKKQSALHNDNQPDKQEKHPERDITY